MVKSTKRLRSRSKRSSKRLRSRSKRSTKRLRLRSRSRRRSSKRLRSRSKRSTKRLRSRSRRRSKRLRIRMRSKSKRLSKRKRDGMNYFRDFTGAITRAIDITGHEISSRMPDFSVKGSYDWYMNAIIESTYEKKINRMKEVISEMLTKEAGIPSHGRSWSDDDLTSFVDILKRPEYSSRKIDSLLLNEVILKKDEELFRSREEEYDMLNEKYPVIGCGMIGDYYKVGDSIVKIIDYDYKNKGCKVKDVFIDKEYTIVPSGLEKRAKDLTNEEIRLIDSKISPKDFTIFSLVYKRLDEEHERKKIK